MSVRVGQEPSPGTAVVILAAGAAVLATLSGWLLPDAFGVQLLFPEGRHVALWTPRARVVGAIGLLLVIVGTFLNRRLLRAGPAPRPAASVAVPLALLPVAYLGFFLGGRLPAAVPPNLLFFVPVLLFSLSLSRLLRSAERHGPGPALTARSVLLIGAAVALLYAAVGWYCTVSVGSHSGDEGHYIVMAESLWQDHDLDLRNNVGEVAERKPRQMHISRYSRGGHLYSWHPIGLPLLLAPLFPLGIAVRHLLLGLLSGLCAAGVAELCRAFGVRRRWSLAVLLLFALSSYWGVYSSRCLPEVGGAALASWGLVALLRQRERPWGTAVLCLACCAYLPWLHERFLPVSGLLVAAYVAAALARADARREALPRLCALSLAYAASLGGYAAVRSTMFIGEFSGRVGSVLFSHPLGTWHTIASSRGLLAVLPLFAAMVAAAVWVALRDRENRWGAVTILVLSAVVLATSASHRSWHGGASLPGRFLVVVVPLFVPCLARALERGGPVVRWWSLFLGLIPCILFLLMLARLPQYRYITDPRGVASIVYDHLNGLVEFFAGSGKSRLHPFALVLFGGTGLLFFCERRWGRAAALLPAAIALAAVAGGDPSLHPRLLKVGASVNARRLAEVGADLERATIQVRGARESLGLFTVSDRFSGEKFPEQVSGPGWVPLPAAFDAGAGPRACRLRGQVTGTAALHWAVREGGRTLLEERLVPGPDGRIDAVARLRCDGSGPVSILVRFEGGEGALRAPAVSWSPFSPALLDAAGFFL